MSPATRPASFPTFLGGCFVRRELARRTLGPVYLARQLSFHRDVALKVMKPQWASNPAFVARFTREAYAAAQLSEHHIASIHEFGEQKGVIYFTTEFVDGKSLATLVHESSPLEFKEAVGYVLQAARGLKCAHDQNLFHRDLSPEVLYVDQSGLVKVVDLGLAKTPDAAAAEEAAFSRKPAAAAVPSSDQTTLPSISIGTPGFSAPSSPAVRPRSDLGPISTRSAARSISSSPAAPRSKAEPPLRSSTGSRPGRSCSPRKGSNPFRAHFRPLS